MKFMGDEEIHKDDVIIYEDRYLFQFSDEYGNPSRLTEFIEKSGDYNYLKVKNNVVYDMMKDTYIEQESFYKNNYTKASDEQTELFLCKLKEAQNAIHNI